jgi:hypothetical protein
MVNLGADGLQISQLQIDDGIAQLEYQLNYIPSNSWEIKIRLLLPRAQCTSPLQENYKVVFRGKG